MSRLLEEFGPSIYLDVVNVFGCPYPTCMVVIQLNEGGGDLDVVARSIDGGTGKAENDIF